MIDRIDLFHLPFYKKEAFTGSDRDFVLDWEDGYEGRRRRGGKAGTEGNSLAGTFCLKAYAG